MPRLLFDPRGRIASGPFLKALLIVLAAQWLFGLPGALGAPTVLVLLLGLIGLAFTYAYICIWVKRLRGGGRSGWWVLAVLFASFLLGMIVSTPIWLMFIVLTFGEVPDAIRKGVSLSDLAVGVEARGWLLLAGSLLMHTLSQAIPYALGVLVDRELNAEADPGRGAEV